MAKARGAAPKPGPIRQKVTTATAKDVGTIGRLHTIKPIILKGDSNFNNLAPKNKD